MENKFIEAVEYLFKKLGIAIDWSQENLMPYFTELVERLTVRGIAFGILDIVISAVLVVGSILFFVKMAKDFKGEKDTLLWDDYYESFTGLGITFTTIATISLFVGVVFLCTGTVDLIDWITIPEVKVYEMIVDMVGGGNG
jgi:hypothetical protein